MPSLNDAKVFYLCKREGCKNSPLCMNDECKHTTKKSEAKFKESVEAADLFLRYFDYMLSEDGEIMFVGKENPDEQW